MITAFITLRLKQVDDMSTLSMVGLLDRTELYYKILEGETGIISPRTLAARKKILDL